MKKVSSILDINFSIPTTVSSMTYIFSKGVLVNVTRYPNGRIGIMVTNANYSDEDFYGKSFGSNYESIEWCRTHLDNWIKQSETN